jgi:Flp pilus assembly protein TadD
MCEYLRDHYAQALALLQRALAKEPKSWALENDLGVVYSSLGKDKEAQSAFEVASAENAGSEVSNTNLSAVSFNIYDYPTSEQAARQALRINPRSRQAQVMLGLAEVAQDHWTGEARRYLEENREQYHQAEVVLEHWPKANDPDYSTAPHIKGAGPGALAGITAQPLRTQQLAMAEK